MKKSEFRRSAVSLCSFSASVSAHNVAHFFRGFAPTALTLTPTIMLGFGIFTKSFADCYIAAFGVATFFPVAWITGKCSVDGHDNYKEFTARKIEKRSKLIPTQLEC